MENTSNVGFLRYFCYLMRFLLSHYKIIFLGLSFSENRSRNVHETYQRMLRYFFCSRNRRYLTTKQLTDLLSSSLVSTIS